VLSRKLERMDKTDQAASGEPGYSNNMTNLSVKKRENLATRILATKFHMKPAEEPGADKEVRLNPIMKDLIINGYIDEHHTPAVKRKRSKRQKTEVKDEVVESIGQNQPAWLDTLKEEIANLK
jgi:hypothetical protein